MAKRKPKVWKVGDFAAVPTQDSYQSGRGHRWRVEILDIREDRFALVSAGAGQRAFGKPRWVALDDLQEVR